MKKDLDILDKPLGGILIKYLAPSIFSMLSIAMLIFVDTMFVGIGTGSDGLAALNISIPIFNIFSASGILIGMGGSIAISISKGTKDYEKVNKIYTLTLVVILIISALYTLFGLLFLDEICVLLGAKGNLIEQVKIYVGFLICFAVPFNLQYTILPIIRNDNAPFIAMIATCIFSFVNIVLDAIFIFVFKMGIFGAVLATCIGCVCAVIVLVYYLIFKSSLKLSRGFFSIDMLKRIIINGFPIAIMELCNGTVIILFNKTLIDIGGPISVSAYSIIANISLVFISIFNGISQGLQPIISMNYGANKIDRVKKSFRLGIITGLSFSSIFFICVYFFPRQLTMMFNSTDENLIKMTIEGMRYYFASLLFISTNIIIISYLQSIEYAKEPLILSLLRGFIFIVIFLPILSNIFDLKGVWITIPLVEMISLIIAFTVFKRLENTDRQVSNLKNIQNVV